MPKHSGYHITPRPGVEEILRLYIEEGYTYRQLADKFNKPFKTIQNTIYNEYKKQRLLVEQGKVPKRPSSLLTPTADQYLALQKENRQLRMENELLRNFYQKLREK